MAALIWVGAALFSLVVIINLWGNWFARKQHATFGKDDVISALENFISETDCCHDEFDLFLLWPIDDPYLESIRNRADDIRRRFPGEPGKDINDQGAAEIRRLIAEVRARS